MSSFSAIEERIAAIEKEVPLEIRVAVSYRPLKFAVGGLRIALLAVSLVVLLLDLLWIPLPGWATPVVCLLAITLPTNVLALLPGTRFLVSKRQRLQNLEDLTLATFRQLKMDATPLGNAVLILFCTSERRFIILPDSQLQVNCPREHWDSYSNSLAKRLRQPGTSTEEGIVAGVLEVLDDLRNQAKVHLGPPRHQGDGAASLRGNQLSNAVVVMK